MKEVATSCLPIEWNEVVGLGKFLKVVEYDTNDSDDAYQETVARIKAESPTGHVAIQEIPEKSLVVFCEVFEGGTGEAAEKTLEVMVRANHKYRADKGLRRHRFSYLTA